MNMEVNVQPRVRKWDFLFALFLGIAAAALYFSSMAGYAFPGIGARLMALWRGLDAPEPALFPLMRPFASVFGFGNALSPVCGVFSVVALYYVSLAFFRSRVGADAALGPVPALTRVGAAVVAAVFMFSPAVMAAATHLEPRMFDFAWALLVIVLMFPFARLPGGVAWIFPLASGVLAGLGMADSPLSLALLPLYFATVWGVSRSRGGSGWGAAAGFLLFFTVTALIYVPVSCGGFSACAEAQKEAYQLYIAPKSRLIFLFATVPFICALFASARGLGERSAGVAQWAFHGALTLFGIIAVATELSPFSILRELGVLPVATTAFAVFTAGYAFVYWSLAVSLAPHEEDSEEKRASHSVQRVLGYVLGGLLSVVLAVSSLISLFSFDSRRGEFADVVAARILDDLGGRTWFVTDGMLDNHLRLAASASGRELNLICLQRDLDRDYLDSLRKTVEEKGLGGAKNADLANVSVSLGVLAFVQDWFAADPEAPKSVAVFGAPDLWMSSDANPVPELLFFGSDPSREPDWSAWKEFDGILSAPKGWGSYRLNEVKDPLELLRLGLRRHMGFVANNRGVWLQNAGRDDEAFSMYELVLDSIDSDNVCALMNEFEMARSGNRRAAAKKVELERALKSIIDDSSRRYVLWRLSSYYGYIRSPEVFVRLGCAWARSGRAGEALAHIRRAIDFLPGSESSNFRLINMMASLYASGNESRKSREMFEKVLSSDPDNHDALMGLMRLALSDGDIEQAKAHLQRAIAVAGDDPRTMTDVALLHIMNGDIGAATDSLRKVTDSDRDNLTAWSMLAATTLQQISAEKDPAEKKRLSKYINDVILPTMEKSSTGPDTFHLQYTRGLVLLSAEGDNRRRARDAFSSAARNRPDIASTGNIVLELDMALDDKDDAERQAKEMLRRNRKEPMANYIMGSIAMNSGRLAEAESFLRRAVDAEKPIPFALNDFAELMRRKGDWREAEKYARRAVAARPDLYVAWETLGSILLDSGSRLEEAENCIRKACDLSKGRDGADTDVRMLISLARVQIAKGDMTAARTTIRKARARVGELSDYEREAFEELRKRVK